ncbi:MAG: HAD-IA family hydrolase [Clostridiales Family XIII bacterium]|nr:HAD-IA family hydrolase [Clostridiales Family XIII bacterium]
MGQLTTVLIDYDGTLMDTYDMVIQSWKYTIRKFTGREPDARDFDPYYGEPILETMPRFLPDVPVTESVGVYREYQKDRYLDDIRPYPGAGAALEALRGRGYKLGLVTSRLRRTTLLGLDHFDLTKYFHEILTADETDKHKPDPTPLLMALERLGSVPAEAVMVGDSTFDLGAARAAGTASVLVDWSIAIPPEKRGQEPGPDAVLKAWADLPELLEALG